jgi:hypothetical protein
MNQSHQFSNPICKNIHAVAIEPSATMLFALTFPMRSAYCELGPCSQYRRVLLRASHRKLEMKAQKVYMKNELK